MSGHVRHVSVPVVRDFRQEMDVERLLVWVYRRQRADLVIGIGAGLHRAEAAVDGIERPGSSACGCATLARIGEFGAKVDGGSGPPGHLHQDAETVHGVVQRLARPVAMLVIQHARVSDQPDWMPGAVSRPVPVANRRGNPLVRYDDWDKGRHHGWCPIEWAPSVARITGLREVYSIWWDALDRLRGQLARTALLDHRVSDRLPPRTPWMSA